MLTKHFTLNSGVYKGKYISYNIILNIQKALKKAGIESYITVGGLSVDCDSWQERMLAKEIIKIFGAWIQSITPLGNERGMSREGHGQQVDKEA